MSSFLEISIAYSCTIFLPINPRVQLSEIRWWILITNPPALFSNLKTWILNSGSFVILKIWDASLFSKSVISFLFFKFTISISIGIFWSIYCFNVFLSISKRILKLSLLFITLMIACFKILAFKVSDISTVPQILFTFVPE